MTAQASFLRLVWSFRIVVSQSVACSLDSWRCGTFSVSTRKYSGQNTTGEAVRSLEGVSRVADSCWKMWKKRASGR